MQVIIAAAGKGLRLYTEAMETSKPLFYYQSKPIIAHLIDVYKTISNDITVIISNDDKGKFTQAWLLDYYKSPNWLNIITQPAPAGTNDALSRIKIKNKCLISWSDFIINQSDFIELSNKFNDQNIFVVGNANCRFSADNNIVTNKRSNYGLIGLYYIAEKVELDLSKEDFVENYLGQKVQTEHLNIKNLGTIPELLENNAFARSSNRFFNEIKMDETKVYKKAITPAAIELQRKEANWYENAPEGLREHLPGYIYRPEENLLVLDKIDGAPLCKTKLDGKFWKIKLPELLEKIHVEAGEVDKISCDDVYIEKPVARYKEVERVIKTWFNGREIINGHDYSEEIMDIPENLYPKEFTFVMGDFNFNNCFMNSAGKLMLIDPRGYFGRTLLKGDPAYDIVKILYATDNYDKINEGKFGLYKMADGDTRLVMAESEYKMNGDVKWFFDWAMERYDISKEKMNYLLYGVWISLTSYIIDNPVGIIAAYCKGCMRMKEGLV